MQILPRERVLPNLLRQRAETAPDQPAIQHVDGTELTWATLDAISRRWADAYRRVGVSQGDTVVTMFPNSFDAYHAWLGVAWLRAIEVPTNNMYMADMLEYLITNSQAEVIAISKRFVERLVPIADRLSRVRTVVVPDATRDEIPVLPFAVVDGDGFFGDAVPAEDLEPIEPWDISAMVYTSGTTGPSKGVLVPWAELHEFVGLMPEDTLEPGGAYYTMFPAFHVSGKSALYVSSAFGERLVLREQFSPQHFLEDVRRFGVTLAGLVGPMATWLMAVPAGDDDADSPLTKVYMGPVIPQVEDFKQRFGVKVATGFGMTEIGAPLASDGWDVSNPASCGRPRTDAYPGYEVRVVDEFDRPLGPGEVGELVIRATAPWTLNAGYWNMPEKTAEAWRNGWFHTGDGFRYDEDGNFYFVDRMKDAIRRRGENISSFEVEALVNRHPAIMTSAAIGVPDDEGSEDEVKVYVVLDPNAAEPPSLQDLYAHLAETMPKFMVPRYLEVIAGLPQTEGTFRTKKVELRALPVVGPDTFDARAAVATS